MQTVVYAAAVITPSAGGEVTLETFDPYSRVFGVIWTRGITGAKRKNPVYLCLNNGMYAYEVSCRLHVSVTTAVSYL